MIGKQVRHATDTSHELSNSPWVEGIGALSSKLRKEGCWLSLVIIFGFGRQKIPYTGQFNRQLVLRRGRFCGMLPLMW